MIVFLQAWSELLAGGRVSPNSTNFDLFWAIIVFIVIITGLTGVPVLLFLFPTHVCTLYFIVAGPDPIEDVVGRDGKFR